MDMSRAANAFLTAIQAGGLAALIASCAAPTAAPDAAKPLRPTVVRVPEPQSLVPGEGLLVGTLAGAAVAQNYHERLWFRHAVVKITGSSGQPVEYVGAINDGNLVLPLKAGDYVLDNVQTQRYPTDKNMRGYPLDIKVHVEAGRAVNIGLIALVRTAGEGKFIRVLIDNTAEVSDRLRKEQRGLFAALDPRAPVAAAPGIIYAKPEEIENLRKEIARDAFGRTDSDASAGYVFGEIGTMARVIRDSKQRVVAYEALPTDTLARIFSCAGDDNRFICSSSEPALYVAKGTAVEKLPLPADSRTWWVDAFSPAGIVLVDENMTIFRSRDDGRTWTKSTWFAVKKPLPSTAHIRTYNGKTGFYLYATEKLDPLAPHALYSEYGRENYRGITVPDMPIWDSLVELRDGLAVGPVYSNDKAQSVFYVRPGSSDRWEERALPDVGCIALRNNSGRGELTVLCSSKRYRSRDEGRNWTLDSASQTGPASAPAGPVS